MQPEEHQLDEGPGSDPATSDPATDTGKGIMNNGIRLSRLNQPRGTLVAMVLLAVVFLLFGVFANALHPELAVSVPESTAGSFAFLNCLN